jgi:hypothetical protein
MDVGELFDTVGGFIALGSLIGVLLLLPLYLSQRRDVRRLHAWMEGEPDYPAQNLATSEARLDAAEAELEKISGETVIAEPGTGSAAAARVTHERPALERITMERAALQPHPRWRRFVSAATQTKVLVAIGLVALVAGVAAIVVTQDLLSTDEGPRGPHVGAIDPADVEVAVLNGTSINGLAGKVASDIEAAGYTVGAITNAAPGVERTEVFYADHQKPAAEKVARDIGVDKVDPVPRDVRDLAGAADVIVIAGEDRD